MTSLPIIQNVCYINFEFSHHFAILTEVQTWKP
jgi:hypothetical protein